MNTVTSVNACIVSDPYTFTEPGSGSRQFSESDPDAGVAEYGYYPDQDQGFYGKKERKIT